MNRFPGLEGRRSLAVTDIPDGWERHGDESAVAEDEERGKALRLGAIPVWERRIYHDASALAHRLRLTGGAKHAPRRRSRASAQRAPCGRNQRSRRSF